MEYLYQDVKAEKAAKLVEALQTQSLGVFQTELTHAAYEYTPATYLICENDHAFSPKDAEGMIDAARKRWSGAFDNVVRCEAGHSPFVSMPGLVGDVIRRAARELRGLETSQ